LGFGMQIPELLTQHNLLQTPELLTQRKFVSATCHAHSNAHKPLKTVAPTVSHFNLALLLAYLHLSFQSRFAACISPFYFNLALLLAYLHFLFGPIF